MEATYSIWADGVEAFDHHFRSLWAAQYTAAINVRQIGSDLQVVDNATGEVMYIYTVTESGHVAASYIASDAIKLTYPDGVIICQEALV